MDALAMPFHAIGKSAKLLVSSTAALAVLCSDSWTPLYYITGALCNALMSKAIKRVVRQPRPAASKKGGYGMPSSHAYLLFYFFTVAALLSRKHYPSYVSTLLSLGMGGYAVTASSWRVADGLHSAAQTMAGASLGLGTGFLVFAKEQQTLSALMSAFPQATKVPPAVKAVVLISGGVALWYKEMNAMRKKRLDT